MSAPRRSRVTFLIPRASKYLKMPVYGIINLLWNRLTSSLAAGFDFAITSKLILDRLVGIKAGHKELLAMLHRVWDQIEEGMAR